MPCVRRSPGRPPPELRAALRDLHPGAIAVDCGAHVGNLTAHMAATGATVYAFEPNPNAFAHLRERFAGNERVRCREAAVTDRDGVARLYLHREAASDPVVWAVGSSLFPTKGNVDERRFVEVDTIDLDRFLWDVGPVTVLKLDVEGAEVPILEKLIESGRLRGISHVLVEMHDQKIPGLDGTALRQALADYANVRLDWL